MRLGILWLFAMLFIEIWSIIKMSEQVGGLATFVLLFAGVIFGLQLMRSQGINAMIKAAQSAGINQSPLAPLADGIVKAFAGILLIIPGFFSDAIALVILLPFVRKAFARYIAKKGQFKGFAAGSFGKGGFGPGAFKRGGFGKPANDDFPDGNLYEHDGGAKSRPPESDDRVVGEQVEGKIIELKPKNKPQDPS